MLDQNMNMEFRIFEKDIVPLNLYDDANKRWLYIKTFNHANGLKKYGFKKYSKAEVLEHSKNIKGVCCSTGKCITCEVKCNNI